LDRRNSNSFQIPEEEATKIVDQLEQKKLAKLVDFYKSNQLEKSKDYSIHSLNVKKKELENLEAKLVREETETWKHAGIHSSLKISRYLS